MWLGVFFVVLMAVLWGIIPSLIKIALRTFDALSIPFFRFALATISLLFFYKFRGGKIRPLLKPSRTIMAASLFLSINYILYTFGVEYTTATATGFIVQVQMVALIVLASIFLRERIGFLKLACILMVMAGIYLIFWEGRSIRVVFGSLSSLGNLFVLIAGILWGFYALFNKKLSGQTEAMEILIPVFTIGTIIMGIFAIPQMRFKGDISPSAIITILVLGIVCTGLNFTLLAEGLKRISAITTGVLTNLSPLFVILFAYLLVGERVNVYVILSAVLIIAGSSGIVFIENYERKSSGTFEEEKPMLTEK